MNTVLKKYEAKKGSPHTHTRIGNPSLGVYGGCYFIPENDVHKFYEKYYEHVFENKGEEYLTEKQLENGPLLIDVDFRYGTDVDERQHTQEHIVDFLEVLTQKIEKIYIPEDQKKLNIYVLEKPNPNILEDKTKDGIHIMMDIKMDVTAKILLRGFLLEEIPKIWDDLCIINTWDDVLDVAVMNGTNNWQLFGSQKPGNERYELVYWYSLMFDKEEKQWDLNRENVNTIDLKHELFKMSCRHMPTVQFNFNPDIKPQYDNLYNLKKNKTFKKKVNRAKAKPIDEICSQEDIDALVEDFLATCDNKMKEIHNYTMILPKEYYDTGSYNNWIRVGWALKNTHDSLLISWIKLSSMSDSFDYTSIQEDLVDRWQMFDVQNEDGLSSRSIIYWAKMNNPEEFDRIKKSTINHYVEQTLNHHMEYDIANVLYQMYKDRFICASISHNIWYEFKENRWVPNDKGNSLRNSISTSLYSLYAEKIIEINKKIRSLQTTQEHLGPAVNNTGSSSGNSGDKTPSSPEMENLKRIKEIYEMIASKKLKTTNQKNNIMTEAKEIFFDEDFMRKVDRNRYLLCFKNAVVDFKRCEIRAGRPEDYITKTTGNDLILADNDDNCEVFKMHGVQVLKSDIPRMPISEFDVYQDEIIDFMEKLFPSGKGGEDDENSYEELRRYVWEHLSSTLLGTIENQTFNIYNGSGANGKSVLVELMSKILGEYKGVVPTTLITQKRNSVGSTSSEVAQLVGVRYAVMQEPSKGDTINEGIMKEITGGDPIQCRQLYRESQTFEPQFKLVVCTNVLFEVNTQDDGTWRRIRVVDFPSKFVKDPYSEKYPRENFPYQFEKDQKLNEKFDKWAPVFMNMLMKLAFNTRGKVTDCKKVIEKSDEYRRDKDFMNEFAMDCIEACVGGKIMKRNLNEVFSNWIIDKHHNKKDRPSNKELHDWVTQRYGKYNNGWKNVQIKAQIGE